ncbi:MAG: aspartate-semialdehyde dehydrogenase [Firmicutes bacterium]|nr:aspartate-semialdehyde dehydrogenase [Bacillota bacterium]
MSKKIKIAVVGATGAVGRTAISVLNEKKIDAEYILFANENGVGTKIEIVGKEWTVQKLTEQAVATYSPNYALFCAGSTVSQGFAKHFNTVGCKVIDNSSLFRRDQSVPLVVPEVNMDAIDKSHNIIANPNCIAVPATVVLKPLQSRYGVKRVVCSTYQAVSGAGIKGVNDLKSGQKHTHFPHPIVDNVIPHIDVFLDNGTTGEEDKIMFEIKKVLKMPNLSISVTSVRVPILNCHSLSLNIELDKDFDIDDIKNLLSASDGIVLADDTANKVYPMPYVANGKDQVFVGRVRRDESKANTLNLFITADNLRKGAATNAVQILEKLLKQI